MFRFFPDPLDVLFCLSFPFKITLFKLFDMLFIITLLFTASSFVFLFPLNELVNSYLVDMLYSVKFYAAMLAILSASIMLISFEKRTLPFYLVLINVLFVYLHYQSLHITSNVIKTDSGNMRRISVGQINLSYNNPHLEQSLKALVGKKLDLLVLMEFSDKNRDLFLDIKGQLHSYGDRPIEGFPTGIGVLSNFPIIYKTLHVLGLGKSVIVELKLLVDDTLLTVFISHPPSPRSKSKWELRNLTLETLQRLVKQEVALGGRVITLGDFNTVPWSRHFTYFASQTSCFKQAGPYVSWSPAKILSSIGLPIDHCFVDATLKIERFRTLPFDGSDHKALLYDVVLN